MIGCCVDCGDFGFDVFGCECVGVEVVECIGI